jgi:hypothetical protein
MPNDTLPAKRATDELQLREFETRLLGFIEEHGLPTASILVEVPQRAVVFQNVETVLAQISQDQLDRSAYISKFLAAAAAGLFDAALNYLWDETISELRRRVAQYDLAYFFDTAVASPDRRKRLKDADDLDKIDDSELINGALQIGLLSDIGFRHLDYIRFMRNWASAAHPNQNNISGLQLVSWLETCVREVINLPLSNIVVEIKRLLASIKADALTRNDAGEIAAFFGRLTTEQADNLVLGFFGIYTAQAATQAARENVQLLLPKLWPHIDEETRQQIGMRYGRFVAANAQEQKALARTFLEVVEAAAYMPADLRVVEIAAAMDSLLAAHRAFNNFYSEPPLARDLQRLVGQLGSVPGTVRQAYVRGLVEVFMTNGNGIAWNAEPVYRELMGQFNQQQAIVAVLSYNDPTISSRLQFKLCKQQYLELLDLLEAKITAPTVVELIEAIRAFTGQFDLLPLDSSVRRLRLRAEKAM